MNNYRDYEYTATLINCSILLNLNLHILEKEEVARYDNAYLLALQKTTHEKFACMQFVVAVRRYFEKTLPSACVHYTFWSFFFKFMH